jgi:hypothetical protein
VVVEDGGQLSRCWAGGGELVSIDRLKWHLIRVYEDIFFVGWHISIDGIVLGSVYLRKSFRLVWEFFSFPFCLSVIFQDSPGDVYDEGKCQSCTLMMCSMGP